MNCKLLGTFFLIMLVFLSVYSQIDTRNSKEQKVKRLVANFNNTLFYEMSPSQAIKKHFYLNNVDSIDSKFGLESDFLTITKGIKKKNKLEYFVIGIYFLSDLEFVQIKLGKEMVRENNKFIDGEMALDKEIQNVWKQILADLGLTEDELDKYESPNENNMDFYATYLQNLNSAIKKKTDPKLIAKNLKFINEHTKIKKEVFERREYFIVENPIFIYRIAIKNGVPKIMSINRN